MVKKISITLFSLVLLVLLVAVLLPSRYHVERSIVINSSPEEVYPFVSNFSEWEKWSIWATLDPNQKVSVTGTVGELGHKQEWDGPINGKGSMTINKVVPNSSVHMNLVFEDPQPMVATTKLELIAKGNQTKVIWHNEGDLDYPVGRLFGLFLDSMLGSDFETSLIRLKEIVETKDSK